MKYYYEIHVTGKNGFSTSIITDSEMDDDDIILKAYEDDILHGDDCHYVDYVQELTYEEWNVHFRDNPYYGDYGFSECDGHNTEYEYFKTKEACYKKLGEVKSSSEYYDIHVYKYSEKYGYEVIDNYLKE